MTSFIELIRLLMKKNPTVIINPENRWLKLRGFAGTTKHYDIFIAEKRADLCLSITQPGLPLGSFGVVLSCGVRARKALFYKAFAGFCF